MPIPLTLALLHRSILLMELVSKDTDDVILRCNRNEALDSCDKIVEVRPSNVHGRGVFAKRDIPVDTVVALYPIDMWYPSISSMDKHVATAVRYGSHVQADRVMEKVESNTYKYVCEGYGTTVVADEDQDMTGTQFIGHMINDGAKIVEVVDDHLLLKTVQVYRSCSLHKQNVSCQVVTNSKGDVVLLPIVTSKPVLCDEELFLSYGSVYWNESANLLLEA